MALPFEIRVRYRDVYSHRTRVRQVRKARAKALYRCEGCGDLILPGDESWYGAGSERLCLDCPNVRVVGKAAA